MGGMVGYGGRDGTLSAFNLVRLHYAAQRPAVQLPPCGLRQRQRDSGCGGFQNAKKRRSRAPQGGQLQPLVGPILRIWLCNRDTLATLVASTPSCRTCMEHRPIENVMMPVVETAAAVGGDGQRDSQAAHLLADSTRRLVDRTSCACVRRQ